MRKYLFVLITVVTLISCSRDKSGMSIVFTGDVILDRGVSDEMQLHGDSLLINSLKVFDKNDFFIVNLEGTFTESDKSQNDLYNFKTDIHKASFLSQGGVSHVSIANNHIYDFGKTGFDNTLDALTDNNLVVLGVSCEPNILKKGNYKCAVLSASLTTHNDSLCIYSIEQLKTSVANFIKKNTTIPLVVYIHWGLELQPTPEKWQRMLARELIELGVDAIIGHHPHVTQTIEFINDKPVFYSVGNYIADAYLPETDRSYTVELEVSDKIDNIKICPINMDDYFPKEITQKEQIINMKHHLRYSNTICAIKQANSWQIKPSESVDFSEKSDLWIFSENNTISTLKRLQSGSHLLTFYVDGNNSNTISLHGDLSEFQVSDIDNDENPDILLGISKKVNFDPIKKKRINIYSYQNKNLQPLWLGTKFIHDIKSFAVTSIDHSNYLTTVEVDEKGSEMQGIYEWDDFGFALIKLKK